MWKEDNYKKLKRKKRGGGYVRECTNEEVYGVYGKPEIDMVVKANRLNCAFV